MPDNQLHPGAWWLWALALATAASATTNLVVLALLGAAASIVVLTRRTDAPWALSFHQYLYVAGVILVLRVLMRLVFRHGDTWDVALHTGAADGLRLAVMIVCIGAANALANPKQLLASLPSAFYEIGTAVVISLSFFPQLAASVQRVSRARRLRATTLPGDGAQRRRRLRLRARAAAARDVLVPVLEDAFDRSLQLAASMDARGYGRSGTATAVQRRMTGALLVLALVGTGIGMYATLDATMPRVLALPMLAFGVICAILGMRQAGRRVVRTRLRQQPWGVDELLVVASGGACAALMFIAARVDTLALHPIGLGVELPPLTWLALAAVLGATAPAWRQPRVSAVERRPAT